MTILAEAPSTSEPPAKGTKFTPITIKLSSRPEPTQDDALWAAAHLAPLPTVVTFRKKRAREYELDGSIYRDAGHISASPTGRERFRVWLAPDATDTDLTFFERRIAEAKTGRFNAWRKSSEDGLQLIWEYDRQISDGTSTVRPGSMLTPCTEPACIAYGSARPFHDTMEYDAAEGWYRHTAECEFAGPGYSIVITRAVDRGVVDDWRVDVSAYTSRDDSARLTSAQAGGFASDLQWAAAEVRRLNGEPLVAVTR
jgi:hypothetical protein